MSTAQSILGLICWLALTFSAAFFGAQFQPGEWYAGLVKPAWNPPNWIFAPVWTLLYIAMAVAAWRVWRESGFGAARGALMAFVFQLALNAAWSWIFFGMKKMGLAALEIVILWLAIAVTLSLFRRHDAVAGWLFVPYLGWVSFASVLNLTLWWLNRSVR